MKAREMGMYMLLIEGIYSLDHKLSLSSRIAYVNWLLEFLAARRRRSWRVSSSRWVDGWVSEGCWALMKMKTPGWGYWAPGDLEKL